ncbi:MAG TPA: hypothetical protein VLF18_09835, partial [Tahibacter sp.]|uniref:hypothetical protein n=1 Tax=Tahibacter sp. TaxID=2056211 RepID=UPI002C7F4A7B
MHAVTSLDDPGFWRRVRALFHALSTLPAAAQAAYLRDAAPSPEVREAARRLLTLRDELTGSRGLPDAGHAAHAMDDAFVDEDSAPATTGFYLERLIGEGGMGRVYLATRELGDTTQHVALKIVPRAADGRRLVEQLRR